MFTMCNAALDACGEWRRPAIATGRIARPLGLAIGLAIGLGIGLGIGIVEGVEEFTYLGSKQ